MSQPLIAFAVLFAFIFAMYGVQRFYLYVALRRITLAVPTRQAIRHDELPEALRPIFDEMTERLEAFGFVSVGYLKGLGLFRTSSQQISYSQYLYHPETSTFANVSPPLAAEPGTIATLVFETWLADGSVISTVNRRNDAGLPLPESYRLVDATAENFAAQWQLHQQRIAGLEGEHLQAYEVMLSHNEHYHRAMLAQWQRDGRIHEVAENQWQPGHLAALRWAFKYFAERKRLSRLPAFTDTPTPQARVAADLHLFGLLDANTAQAMLGRRMKSVLFVISLAFGAVAFGLLFSWQSVPVLLGVLLFHEFGHALAMRYTGHQGVQVMVIPLLGAVAMGRKDDATPWQRLLVLLAGPLPGLIIAVLVLLLIHQAPANYPLLLQIALTALLLNLFNLLPLTPLDGGRIVELFIFSRWPRARIVFFAASTLGIAALAVWLESIPLFVFALFLVMLTRRFHFNFSVARQIGRVDRAHAPRAIFSALHGRDGKRTKSFAQRFAVVRAVLPMIIARPVSLHESLIGMSLYAAAIALPFVTLSSVEPAQRLYHYVTAAKQQSAEQMPDDWRQQLARAKDDDERFAILFEQAQYAEDDDDEPDNAHALYQQALGTAHHLPPGDLRVLDAKLGLARTDGDDALRLSAYRTLFAETARLQGKERYRHALLLDEIVELDSDASIKQKIGYLHEAIDAWRSNPDAKYSIGNDHVKIGRLLFAEGKVNETETELRAAVAANDTPYLALPLAWFLIDQQRPDEAEGVLQNYPADMKSSPYLGSKLIDAMAWSLWRQGKHAAARKVMSDALAQSDRGSFWARRAMMFDMVTFADDDLVLRTYWRAKLKRALFESDEDYASVRQDIALWRDGEPWDSARTVTRYEVLRLLGMPQQSTASVCR